MKVQEIWPDAQCPYCDCKDLGLMHHGKLKLSVYFACCKCLRHTQARYNEIDGWYIFKRKKMTE